MFVVSEISPQHHGEHHIAERMILQSKFGGAKAVKVQQYDPEQFNKPESYAKSKEQLRDLPDFGDAHDIPVFAAAFAPNFLDWCVDLDFKYLKVATRMHVSFPELTRDVMQVRKPRFLSNLADVPQTITKE